MARQPFPDNQGSTSWIDMANNIILLHMDTDDTVQPDTSGGGYDGECVSGAAYTASGCIAGGVDTGLADSGKRMVIGSGPARARKNKFSTSMLVKRAENGVGFKCVIRTTSTTSGAAVGYWDSDDKFWIAKDGVGPVVHSSATVTDSNWHHLAVTHPDDGLGNQKIYLDGVDVTDGATTDICSGFGGGADTITLNGFSPNATQYTSGGTLDEFAYFEDRILTPEEVYAIYQAQIVGAAAPPVILTASPITAAEVGVPGSILITASGDTPITWTELTGSWPVWVTSAVQEGDGYRVSWLDPTAGDGQGDMELQATNSEGEDTKIFTFNVAAGPVGTDRKAAIGDVDGGTGVPTLRNQEWTAGDRLTDPDGARLAREDDTVMQAALGAPNGVAPLDGDALVPAENLPPLPSVASYAADCKMVLLTPPEILIQGERYIVGNPAGGDWTGNEGAIAVRGAGVWAFEYPNAGAIVATSADAKRWKLRHNLTDWDEMMDRTDVDAIIGRDLVTVIDDRDEMPGVNYQTPQDALDYLGTLPLSNQRRGMVVIYPKSDGTQWTDTPLDFTGLTNITIQGFPQSLPGTDGTSGWGTLDMVWTTGGQGLIRRVNSGTYIRFQNIRFQIDAGALEYRCGELDLDGCEVQIALGAAVHTDRQYTSFTGRMRRCSVVAYGGFTAVTNQSIGWTFEDCGVDGIGGVTDDLGGAPLGLMQMTFRRCWATTGAPLGAALISLGLSNASSWVKFEGFTCPRTGSAQALIEAGGYGTIKATALDLADWTVAESITIEGDCVAHQEIPREGTWRWHDAGMSGFVAQQYRSGVWVDSNTVIEPPEI